MAESSAEEMKEEGRGSRASSATSSRSVPRTRLDNDPRLTFSRGQFCWHKNKPGQNYPVVIIELDKDVRKEEWEGLSENTKEKLKKAKYVFRYVYSDNVDKGDIGLVNSNDNLESWRRGLSKRFDKNIPKKYLDGVSYASKQVEQNPKWKRMEDEFEATIHMIENEYKEAVEAPETGQVAEIEQKPKQKSGRPQSKKLLSSSSALIQPRHGEDAVDYLNGEKERMAECKQQQTKVEYGMPAQKRSKLDEQESYVCNISSSLRAESAHDINNVPSVQKAGGDETNENAVSTRKIEEMGYRAAVFDQTIKIGVVGLTGMGRIVALGLKRKGGVTLSAVFDVDRAKAKSVADRLDESVRVRVASDPADMWALCDVLFCCCNEEQLNVDCLYDGLTVLQRMLQSLNAQDKKGLILMQPMQPRVLAITANDLRSAAGRVDVLGVGVVGTMEPRMATMFVSGSDSLFQLCKPALMLFAIQLRYREESKTFVDGIILGLAANRLNADLLQSATWAHSLLKCYNLSGLSTELANAFSPDAWLNLIKTALTDSGKDETSLLRFVGSTEDAKRAAQVAALTEHSSASGSLVRASNHFIKAATFDRSNKKMAVEVIQKDF